MNTCINNLRHWFPVLWKIQVPNPYLRLNGSGYWRWRWEGGWERWRARNNVCLQQAYQVILMSTQVQKPQLILSLFKNEEGPGALLNPCIMVCVNFGCPIVWHRDLSWTSCSSIFSIASRKIEKRHFLSPWVSTLLPRCGTDKQKCFSMTWYRKELSKYAQEVYVLL